MDDEPGDAVFLFEIMNEIVDYLIARPKKYVKAFSKIPEGKRKAIEERDKKKST